MRVFVSYRRADSPQAVGRIYDKLVACYGADSVFKDVDSIPAGSDFRHVLEDSLATCDVLVAIIGGRWLTTAEGESRLNEPSDLESRSGMGETPRLQATPSGGLRYDARRCPRIVEPPILCIACTITSCSSRSIASRY